MQRFEIFEGPSLYGSQIQNRPSGYQVNPWGFDFL